MLANRAFEDADRSVNPIRLAGLACFVGSSCYDAKRHAIYETLFQAKFQQYK